VIDLDTYTYVVHPYDKFFNYMEKNETKPENLPDLPYEVGVKLDGSEGILYPAKNGSIRIITKGGFETSQGEFATRLMWTKYTQQATQIYNNRLYKDYTLTFEILYAKDDVNRIVVAYDEPDLRLIGVRDLRTGRTFSYSEVIAFAAKIGFPATEVEELTLDQLMELRKDRENFEGWVVRFENGLYMKIKCEPYLDAHGARFGTSLKAVFNLIKEGKWDDFIASIAEENRATPEALKKKLVGFATDFMRKVFAAYESIPSIEAQKDFGLYVQNNIEQHLRGYMFTIRADKNANVFEQPWSRFKLLYEVWEAEQNVGK
jgi:RNA ligase